MRLSDTQAAPSGLPASEPRAFVLHPGDVVLAQQGDRVETLLGSCVAIALTDPRRTLATLCHLVHTRPVLGAPREDGCYAEVALARSFALLRARGIEPRLCEAFVIGGGNMFGDIYQQAHVGARNVAWALDVLALQGIPVVLQNTGGACYRRLCWTVGPEAPAVRSVDVAVD